MKVLYIAGWGRSGTTLLDNILGAYDSVFSVGELYYLWARGLIEKRMCGCGEMLIECPLWSQVLDIMYKGASFDARAFYQMQQRTIRVRRTRQLARGELDPETTHYRDELARLYAALGTVTGAEVIVDSSKTPAGAAILTRCPDVEPYLLHMIRDPRAVARSWSRPTVQPDLRIPRNMPQHTAATSTTTWIYWNHLVEELAKREYAGRARRLRYEDFVADPRGTVTSLIEFVGQPTTGSPFTGRSTVALTPNHTVGGNPARFRTGTVEIKSDDKWRADQDRRDRMVSTALAIPQLHRYRYSVAPDRRR